METKYLKNKQLLCLVLAGDAQGVSKGWKDKSVYVGVVLPRDEGKYKQMRLGEYQEKLTVALT